MSDQTYEFDSIDDFDVHFTRLHNYLMFIDIKANALKLFLHYARLCMLRNKQVTTSDETIASMSNMSAKTVGRSRQELVDSGLIQVIERPGLPYIIKIDFTSLRKANELFWGERDIMGRLKEMTSDKSSEQPQTKVPNTSDKSSDKELKDKNKGKELSLSPTGDGTQFLVSKSGTVHSNDKGQPLCGSSAKKLTETNEGEVTCKSCRKKLGLDDVRDPIKDWAAYHIFKSNPHSVPESLGYLVGNWRNGIHEVHKTKCKGRDLVEPTIDHLEKWKEWYDQQTKGKVAYPRDRAKIVASYSEFYDEMRRQNGNGHTETESTDADNEYKNVIDETATPPMKVFSHE